MKRLETLLELVAVFLTLVLLNVLASTYFFTIDLTEDKRYTLTPATKRTLENLNEPIYLEVYLEGALNTDFKRLQQAVREKLEEFASYSDRSVQYRFRDPNEVAPEGEARQKFFQQLTRLGIPPTQLTRQESGKVLQETVFPGAVLRYGNKELGVLLLKGNKTASPEEQLNQSLENIEFELISTIEQLTRTRKPSVGLITGVDELRPVDTYAMRRALSEGYIVEEVDLEKRDPKQYDALILAQPKKRLNETQRYRLDQYIMQGGKVLFFLDKVQMNLDSIATGGTYAFAYDLNLEDMLFNYGIRVNMDLLQDQLLHGFLKVNTGKFGNQANFQRLPWVYNVIVNRFAENHPITRNLDAIYTQFVSSLDTVRSPEIKKTPLLFTSQYTRIKKCPTMIDLNEIKMLGQNPELFDKSFLPVAYLLEGEFRSLYDGRFPPRQFDRSKYLNRSQQTRILVCSDGDLIRNALDPRTKQPLPLGYDPITGGMFSNEDFLRNALAYLIDPEGVIASRTRVVKMRPLDRTRLQNETQLWQGINLVLPLVLLGILAVILVVLRRRKYGK